MAVTDPAATDFIGPGKSDQQENQKLKKITEISFSGSPLNLNCEPHFCCMV